MREEFDLLNSMMVRELVRSSQQIHIVRWIDLFFFIEKK